MKKFLKGVLGLVIVLAVMTVIFPQQAMHAAQSVGEQALLKMRFGQDGVQGQANGVLQTTELSTLSASVASATLTQVVAAPATSSTYLRGILVEKSTGAGGTFTVQTGTGTNCGTGTAVLLGPVTNPPIGTIHLGIVVPATSAVCLQTDAATTLVRAIYE